MRFSVELTRQARADFDRLDVWLTARDPQAAAQVADLLEAAIDSLMAYPHRGRPVDETARELTIRFGQAGYILRYDVLGQRVFITRVWHSLEHR